MAFLVDCGPNVDATSLTNLLRQETSHVIVPSVHPKPAVGKLSHVCFAGIEMRQSQAPRVRPTRWPAEGSRSRRKEAQWFSQREQGFAGPGAVCEAEQPDEFLVWLLEQAGLDARAYRTGALQRRLPACLRVLRAPSPQAAKAVLERKPELLSQAVSAVLIGVSEFFRDRAVFDYLRSAVLPQLLQDRRGLRVLSAGCSDGQELYSMAMLLDDLGALDTSCLLGVDCRSEAIARAEAGWFQVAELEGVEPERRQRYFLLQEERALVLPALCARMQWRVGDMASCGEVAGWDVILFRNLAIYLKPDRAAAVWERLAGQLAPGGVLVTGKAERPAAGLLLRRASPCVYEKLES